MSKEEFVEAFIEHQDNKKKAKRNTQREIVEMKIDFARRTYKKKRVAK